MDPINKKYPIEELLDACKNYPSLSNSKRIPFEYVMLKGVNDSESEARDLVKLISGIPAKINLIPFNPWPGSSYECSDWDQIEKFGDIVNSIHRIINCIARLSIASSVNYGIGGSIDNKNSLFSHKLLIDIINQITNSINLLVPSIDRLIDGRGTDE